MSKRRYSTINCKRVDWSALAREAAGQRVVFAVDVAKHAFVAAVQPASNQTRVRLTWTHPEQTGELLAGLEQLAAAGKLEVVMESSGVYGDALRWQLHRRGIVVYNVAAKRVHDSAELRDGVPSLHDAKAVELIAWLHWEGCSRRWHMADETRRALLAQSRRLRQAKRRAQSERNRLEALLSRHWPEVTPILGLHSAALHRLIATYGTPGPLLVLGAQARQLMRGVGGHWLAEEKIEAVLASARTTLGMPATEAEAVQLRWQAEQVIAAQREQRRAERLLVDTVPRAQRRPMHIQMGQVTTAVLLATQGDPKGYPSAASYCKGIGLNLKERSSGKHQGQLKITKRGPSLARHYLYFAALRLIAREPTVKRWFEIKTARPGAIKHKQVIELMRKLAKAFWHHANGHPFDVERLVNLNALPEA
jgi:transposase